MSVCSALNAAILLNRDNSGHMCHAESLVTTYADPVHSTQDMAKEAFAAMRMGNLEDDKQTWVTLRPRHMAARESEAFVTTDHPLFTRVNATLYTYMQTTPVRDERDLCGDVNHILTTPVTARDGDPTAIIFYSVASFTDSMKGAGADIINKVYNRFVDQPDLKLSTLSPFRGFTQWIENNYGNSDACRGQDETIQRLAIEYILQLKQSALTFHLKNGAYIGDINLNANAPKSADDAEGMNVMMNYVYPDRAQRMANIDAYANGHITFSPHLYDTVKTLSTCRQGAVRIQGVRPEHPWTLKLGMF